MVFRLLFSLPDIPHFSRTTSRRRACGECRVYVSCSEGCEKFGSPHAEIPVETPQALSNPFVRYPAPSGRLSQSHLDLRRSEAGGDDAPTRWFRRGPGRRLGTSLRRPVLGGPFFSNSSPLRRGRGIKFSHKTELSSDGVALSSNPLRGIAWNGVTRAARISRLSVCIEVSRDDSGYHEDAPGTHRGARRRMAAAVERLARPEAQELW